MIDNLSNKEREQISEILNRRANEIAVFHSDYTKDNNHFGSVELALSREIQRLRKLSEKVLPTSDD